MQTKPLTKIQQGWLDHVNQATKLKLSMSAYAKQKNLALNTKYWTVTFHYQQNQQLDNLNLWVSRTLYY